MQRVFGSCVVALLGVLLISATSRGQCTLEEDLKVLSSDGAEGDAFGGPLSVDGNVLVIGAPHADSPAPNAGAAYVHRKIAGVWTEELKLTSSDPQGFDNYGIAVAVEGDLIAVGAFYDDNLLPDDGSVFVYRHDGAAWVEEQQLTASTPGFGDRFGRAVAINGDWLAVGAYRSDDLGIDSGSVYLFQFDGGSWIERQRIFASDGAAGDLYGVSLSFSGDALMVGAYFDDTTFTNTGSAYIYRYDGATWSEEQKLTAPDAGPDNEFGAFIALQGNTAVAGAYGYGDLGSSFGATYIYEFELGTWVLSQKITASDGTAGDEFGWGVALQGNLLAVGAYKDDQQGHEAGSAYVFRHDGGGWIEERKLIASDAAADDLFATSVSLSGTDLWIGTRGSDDLGTDSGSAYFYDVRALGLRAESTSVAEGQDLTLNTGPGTSGNLAALFAVELGGTPVFLHLVTKPYDMDCNMQFSVTVPAGLTGLVVDFRSYGYAITGVLHWTNVETVNFL